MSKYDYIAFDLDGTLTNPEKGLVDGFVYAFRKLGIDYGERESLRRFIGPPLYDEWRREYGFNYEEVCHAIDVFREYYNIYGWWDNEIYDGIEKMLTELRDSGKTLLLATSKPKDTAEKVLALFGLDKYFTYVAGASNDGTNDIKWKILDRALAEVGAKDKSKAILVGDRKYDAEGAAIVGCDSLGVLWGHGTREELEDAGCTYLFSTPEEVAQFLK